MIKRIILLTLLAIFCRHAHSQVLISLILGDNLNSGKVEFGLDGGVNLSEQTGLSTHKILPTFNLGFYFDIKLKNAWLIHTGVIVKSSMGAGNLPAYPLGSPDLDASFEGGSVDRKLNYFNVPIMIKYRFKNHLFVETGPMLGLLYQATDEFTNTVKGDELTYRKNIRDNFHPLDAGWMAGVGYRLMKGNGMNLGIRYYAGFVDVAIDDSGSSVKNQSLYFTVGIPIGVGKAKARAKAKEEALKE
ncbi:MAG TPA: porin family protein [Ohtaekwangia sp.]